jgi:hypothetical protein
VYATRLKSALGGGPGEKPIDEALETLIEKAKEEGRAPIPKM